MRPRHYITAAALIAAFTIGCSKSSTQTGTEQGALDKLQKQYQDQEKQIQEAQAKLETLRQKYSTNGPPYLKQSRTLDSMISFHRVLYAKIEAEKIGQQPHQVTAQPSIKDLGVIAFTEGASQHFSLGDSKSCTLIAKPGSGGMIEIAATIETTNADGTVTLIGKPKITDAPGSPCSMTVGDVGIGFTPRWKKP